MMQEEVPKINIDWLIAKTGDPFADTGGAVIKILFQEKKHEDILKLIEEITKVYVRNWNAKLNAFFLNSKITQPAFKGERKISETIKYFTQLLNDELPFEEGYCRILGKKTHLFNSGRDNNIMVGSGTFINFHHAFQNGLQLSKEALIRLFFVPFGCVQLTDKVALLQSNNEEINTFFVQENIQENQRKLGTQSAVGINKSDFKSPASALFDFAKYWITEVEDTEEENIELNLYHFTNFGASPEIVLYSFSAALYTFYAKVQHRTVKDDWQRFANSYFRQKSATYNYEKNAFEVKLKEETQIVDYQSFKIWQNPIYESLLHNKPIIKAIRKWVQKHPFNFRIVKLYQKYLKNMDEKTLIIIERIADYILLDTDSLKQKIRSLQMPTKSHAFRKALLKLEQKNHLQRNPEPLFSLREFAQELFPDGTYWQEIQDLLLISLFQKMHERELWFDDAEEMITAIESETESN